MPYAPAVPDPSIRLAEIMATLSLGSDAGMGVPEELAVRSAVLARALADAAKLPAETVRDAYDVAMLRMVGCTAESHVSAEVMGDELHLRGHMLGLDTGDPRAVLGTAIRHIGEERAFPSRVWAVLRGLAGMSGLYGTALAHCEVAATLVVEFGLSANVSAALRQVYERWDASGMPDKLRGESIAPAARVAAVAYDTASTHLAHGSDAVPVMLRARAGRGLDPTLAALMSEHAPAVLAAFDTGSPLAAALDAEPKPHRTLEGDAVDRALAALGDFADLKCQWTTGHSRGVAALAQAAARRLGLSSSDVCAIHRSGLVHDLGRVAVSAAVWDKRGPLTDLERERASMHTYHGERILSRAPTLAGLVPYATFAHERIDGTGYHRKATALPMPARILAVADVAHALLEVRPWRDGHSREQVAALLRGSSGFAPDVVDAVLAELGVPTPVPPERRRGLSDREVEVLRLVARGLTNKEVANALDLSPKTVGHHLEKIFAKVGVTTRAGATLFAMQHGLLAP